MTAGNFNPRARAAGVLAAVAGRNAQEGLAFYRAVAKHVSDPDVRALFLELAADEQRHMHDLEQMEARGQTNLPSRDGSLLANYIQGIVDTEVLRPVSELGPVTGTIHGLVQAIGYGIRAETRAIELYSRARDEAGSTAAAEGFRRLLDMEQRHLALLTELRDRLTTEPPPDD